MSVCKECQAKFQEIVQICEKCGSDDIEVVRKTKKEIVRFAGGEHSFYDQNDVDSDSEDENHFPYYTPVDDFYSNPNARKSLEQLKKETPFVAITSPKQNVEFFTPNKTTNDGRHELPKLGYGDFIDEEYGKQLMNIGKQWRETKERIKKEEEEKAYARKNPFFKIPEKEKKIGRLRESLLSLGISTTLKHGQWERVYDKKCNGNGIFIGAGVTIYGENEQDIDLCGEGESLFGFVMGCCPQLEQIPSEGYFYNDFDNPFYDNQYVQVGSPTIGNVCLVVSRIGVSFRVGDKLKCVDGMFEVVQPDDEYQMVAMESVNGYPNTCKYFYAKYIGNGHVPMLKNNIFPTQLTFEERYPESNKYTPPEPLKKIDDFFNKTKKKKILIKNMYEISLYRWNRFVERKVIHIPCPFCIDSGYYYQSNKYCCEYKCRINHKICGNKNSLYEKYSKTGNNRKAKKYAKKTIKLIKKEIKKINKKELKNNKDKKIDLINWM